VKTSDWCLKAKEWESQKNHKEGLMIAFARRLVSGPKAVLVGLCLCLAWLTAQGAAAQTQIKPRILIIFDVSGSMLQNTSDGSMNDTMTNGDGSWDPWGGRFCCPGSGNSRIYASKEAMRQMVFATGDIEFALMKFAQLYSPTDADRRSPTNFYVGNQVDGARDYLRYGQGSDGCEPDFVPYGDPFDYQWLCVEFPDLSMPDNRGPIMMWMDHHEFLDDGSGDPDTVPQGWSRAEGTSSGQPNIPRSRNPCSPPRTI
jgi:hypothetical protein